jgi:hypothetical protein
MIKIEPKYNAALLFCDDALCIYFSRYPDLEIVKDIFSLEDNPGVSLNKWAVAPTSDIFMVAATPATDKEPRTYYQLFVPPTYEIEEFTKIVAQHLIDAHGLTVKVERYNDDDFDGAEVMV